VSVTSAFGPSGQTISDGPGVVNETAERSARLGRTRRVRFFYVGIAAFMCGIVLVGFWPSYFGPALRGNIDRPWVIQLHGLVFVGWMALLVTQVVLVSRGRTSAHRRVGTWGIAYGCAVLVMGLVAGIAAPLIHLRAGEWDVDRAAGFLLTIFGDMILFGSFFAAAVMYRGRPQIHKRLMLTATVALLFAAVGRMHFASQVVYEIVWLSPLFIAMAYDWKSQGRVHPAYVIGTVALFIGSTRELFTESETWLIVGRAILRTLM
jgi:hypothetical protein